MVNERPVQEQNMQEALGKVQFNFSKFRFDDGDEMVVYIKASIMPDSVFTSSTGLQPAFYGIIMNQDLKTNLFFVVGLSSNNDHPA